MERLAVVAAAGAALLVTPVRERLIPVSKAMSRAGFGLAGTLITGARDVADAALHGEPTGNGTGRRGGTRAPAKTASRTSTKRDSRGPAKATTKGSAKATTRGSTRRAAGTASKSGGRSSTASRSGTAKRTTPRKRS